MARKITGSYFRDQRYQTGIEYFDLGNFKKAIKSFYKHLSKFPNDLEIYALIGASYYYLGNFKKCIEESTKAINFNINTGFAYLYRGMSFYGRGKFY